MPDTDRLADGKQQLARLLDDRARLIGALRELLRDWRCSSGLPAIRATVEQAERVLIRVEG